MSERLLLDCGSGGRAQQELIAAFFQKYLGNPILDRFDDAALLAGLGETVVMSTDSYTVTPLFFRGGSIGSLAVHGTVNDVSMLGASPMYLSCAVILEEGLSLDVLEQVVQDMAKAAQRANVVVVTGDTKVVPKGSVDQMFINTTGLGRLLTKTPPQGDRARAGDVVLVSGSIGDHGLCIMQSREQLEVSSDVSSDSCALNHMVARLLKGISDVHVLRDPTRGGLATTLTEIAEQSKVGIRIYEEALPIHESVRSGCSFLGLDPLYLANEGKCICIVQAKDAEKACSLLKEDPCGRDACIIGVVTEEYRGKVLLETAIGGERLLGMLEGAQLPRIC